MRHTKHRRPLLERRRDIHGEVLVWRAGPRGRVEELRLVRTRVEDVAEVV